MRPPKSLVMSKLETPNQLWILLLFCYRSFLTLLEVYLVVDIVVWRAFQGQKYCLLCIQWILDSRLFFRLTIYLLLFLLVVRIFGFLWLIAKDCKFVNLISTIFVLLTPNEKAENVDAIDDVSLLAFTFSQEFSYETWLLCRSMLPDISQEKLANYVNKTAPIRI